MSPSATAARMIWPRRPRGCRLRDALSPSVVIVASHFRYRVDGRWIAVGVTFAGEGDNERRSGPDLTRPVVIADPGGHDARPGWYPVAALSPR